ncbi:PspC domain-containing protein [Pedobacter sp. SD-b]|uniref:PspC domain-containing protein n=1 Tax=Pedobacter segetis TaxID=2793069 RepID=A0ABS1BFB7_9SPHI|nr:PspC domain-containing protein [Pedobacter segetis]MBK0381558.1 PspC domain-containing protein [Pedobacter segetis]
MNKTIIINISGVIFHIEEDAYEALKNYINDVKRHFASYRDNFEIITDIENRVAEMFNDLLIADSKQVIVIGDVALVTSRMGNPADFETEEETEKQPIDARSLRERKLFRDMDDRVIGGVCAGIGHYFDIEARWIRVAFFILFVFYGFGLIPYIIFWVLIPKAGTRTERMEMKGEKINLQSFQKNVEEELNAVKSNFINATNNARPGLNRLGSFIRDVISQLLKFAGTTGKIIIKVIGFFIIVFASIVLISAFVALLIFLGYAGSADINTIYPLNALRETLRPVIFVSAFLVVFIPLLGLIIFTLRVFFNNHKVSKSVSFSMLMIWILALGTGIFFIAKNATDFKEQASYSESIGLKNNPNKVYYLQGGEERTLQEDISNINGSDRIVTITRNDKDFDTPNRVNISLKIADNDLPSLIKTYSARGRNFDAAIKSAHDIEYYLFQKDSLITFDYQSGLKGQSLWRDQEVNIKLNIPVNSVLYIDRDLARHFFRNQMNDCIEDGESKYILVRATKEGFSCKKSANAIEREKQYNEENDIKEPLNNEVLFN